MTQITKLLGDKADYLLNFNNPKISKERRRHSSSSKPKVLVPVETPEEEDIANAEPGSARRRKFRKRRREHRGRNPTLAETGGLPPVRDQEPMNPTQ